MPILLAPHLRRAIIGRLSLALLLGTLTAPTVAYLGAVTDSTLDFGGYGDGSVSVLREHNTWWEVVTIAQHAGTPHRAAKVVRGVQRWDHALTSDGLSEAESGRAARHAEGESTAPSIDLGSTTVTFIGWPCRSFYGTLVDRLDGPAVTGLYDPHWISDNIRYIRQPLPTHPWWPGLAANTLLFAAAWAIPTALPLVLRATTRRRRGHCQACGYDIRSSRGPACPECGATTPPRAHARSVAESSSTV